MLRWEEYVLDTEQRSNDAAEKDVQIKSSVEVCVEGTEQSSNYAAATDAQTEPSVEECAEDTGHITTQTMNLLHLDPNSTCLPQPNHYPISVLLEQPQEMGKEEIAFLER